MAKVTINGFGPIVIRPDCTVWEMYQRDKAKGNGIRFHRYEVDFENRIHFQFLFRDSSRLLYELCKRDAKGNWELEYMGDIKASMRSLKSYVRRRIHADEKIEFVEI